MKWLLCSSVVLLASNEAIPNSMLDPVARLGAVGVIGIVLIFLVTRTLPRFAKAIEAQTVALNAQTIVLNDLKLHCSRRQIEVNGSP